MFRLALVIALLAACGEDEPPPAPAPIGPPAGFDELEWGEQLYQTRGCLACHRIDGGESVGPPLDGVAGQGRTLADGRTVIADVDYLREAIEAPEAAVVAGYEDVMPTYRELLAPAEMEALIAYLQHLSLRTR